MPEAQGSILVNVIDICQRDRVKKLRRFGAKPFAVFTMNTVTFITTPGPMLNLQ